MLSTGSLIGRVFNPLPRDFRELSDPSTEGVLLQPGLSVLVQPCCVTVVEAVNVLSNYVTKIGIKLGSNKIEAVLAKPLNVSILFDNKLRLLKPLQTPPSLIRHIRTFNSLRPV